MRRRGGLRANLGRIYLIYTGGLLAFVFLLGALDSLGLPNQYIGYAFVVLVFAPYAVIGILSRAGEASGHYADGRRVSAVYNGMATGAEWMGAASFLGFAGTLYILGYDGLAYILGCTGGFVLVAILIAPYLRKFGAATVPDFFGERYGGTLPRLLAVIVLILASCTFLAAQIYGTGLIASRLLGVDFTLAVYVSLAGVLLCSTLGGMKAVTSAQAAQYIVLLIAYLTPVIILSIQKYGNPIPQIAYGQALQDIAALEQGFVAQRLADARALKPHAQPFVNLDALNFFGLILCMMVGTASLPHVLMRYFTTLSAREARMSVAWSIFFVFLVFFTAPAYAAFAKLEIYSSLIGQPLAKLPEWVYVYGAMLDPMRPGHGLVDICGKAALDAQTALANCGKSHPGILRLQDFSIDPDVIVISLPEIAGMPFVIAGLVAAGGLAAALSTANGLLLAIASALSSDASHKTLNPAAPPQRRLVATRALLVAVAVLAAWTASRKPSDILSMAAWAFSLAAAGLFPSLVLGIWWKRATAWGCVAGMIVGLAITMYYLVGTRFFAVAFYETWSALSSASDLAAYKFGTLKQAWMKTPEGAAKAAAWLAFDAHARTIANWWGVKNISAALFGLPAGFLAVVLVSLATKAPPADTRGTIEAMRGPDGVAGKENL